MTTQTEGFDTSRLPSPGAGFVWERSGPTLVLRPQTPACVAAFTTRTGGLSGAQWHALNVSYAVGDDESCVGANRELAAASVGGGTFSNARQVHGRDIVRAVCGLHPQAADGVWTDEPDATLAVLAADCVPILLVGERGIAAVHAGWRGLLAGVIENAAETIGATAVFAGPGIGPCCFEVGQDVLDRFDPSAHAESRVDLWSAAQRAAGDAEFHAARICTSCNPDLYFSHRRDKGRTGRQALVARLP